MTTIDYHSDIQEFVDTHEPTVEQQFRCLVEEIGELAEALNTEQNEAIAEEIGDVIFVAETLAILHGIDANRTTAMVAAENLEKDTGTDGAKITKATGGDGT